MTEQDPFLHDRGVDASEHESPESFAQDKFDRLMNLDHYGVRFVNRGEYNAIFAERKIGDEAFWVGGPRVDIFGTSMDKSPIPFSKYAKFGKGNFRRWGHIAASQNDWDAARETGDIVEYKNILTKILLARKKAEKEKSQEKRKEIYQNIHNNLKDRVDAMQKRIIELRNDIEAYYQQLRRHYGDDKINKIHQIIDENFEKISPEQIDLKVRKEFGRSPKDNFGMSIILALCYSKQWLIGIKPEDEAVLSAFQSDTDYFLRSGNLRRVVNILGYSPFNQRAHYGGGPHPEHRSYHIAVIIDDSIFRDSSQILTWGFIDRKDFEPRKDILGAIAVMPNKELVEEMKEVSAGSHPIFAANGVCLYPRQKDSGVMEPIS